VAATLAEVAESLARTARELHEMNREEWMDAEGARSHLSLTKKQWERIAPRLPRHYLSERVIRYSKHELDQALLGSTRPKDATTLDDSLTTNPLGFMGAGADQGGAS